MTEYRHLAEMGIEDVADIEKYTLRQEGDEDVIKIYLKRDKGEWFARSRKFKFKRYVKTVRINEGAQHYREVSEMNPFLLRAVDELDSLVAKDQRKMSEKELLLEELDHLEKVVSRKITDLRAQIENMK
ncbi:hypothetical protein WH50_03005 [Pokkaliibacter plantistimulans]|uniref:Uncharacterized protein n=2 Tax=Pseudomonadota TaxID=1224 RepID=A0ABX5M2V4_9GAMM|nr:MULTISPECIES: DUF3461 family protein [Pokkaliibacter]MDH2436016.1 DUF3461 family protein [Pokkaliibacter sp. MBI-7]PXF32699.1 hypothetical protein WH50_03005 [Pokkaliibacter plantistimulans]